MLRDRKAKLKEYTGTAQEKLAQFEAEFTEDITSAEEIEADIKYWRGIGKAIENKISLGQSILANITSQVKAGMYLNNVK